ncbi:MAG: M14 family zinc carboxypeptidase [Planctomycetota bacterium]
MLRSACVLALTASLSAQSQTTWEYRFAVPLTPSRGMALELSFDTGHGRGTDADVHVFVLDGPERDAFLMQFPDAILVGRGQPFANFAFPAAPDPGYYTTTEIVQELDALVAAYPGLCRRVSVSSLPGASLTHNGASIWALVVSDNVAVDEDEPAIVLASQHHARELNSPHMVLRAAQRVLGGYAGVPALHALVDDHEIWFVPCVNPDGVDHVWGVDNLWRKNRRSNGDGTFGVDLNRNYTSHYGLCGASTVTSSETYRGPFAASEPEVRTMRALIAYLRPQLYLDFHSYGQDVLATYAPCVTAGATIQGLIDRYVDDLRTPMNYARRAPSAAGESCEDHWISNGTLSFLIEVGTAFQPAFSATVTEEARVWPGVQRALTTWKPALRGHVRSLRGGAPLQATIGYSPNVFTFGEIDRSRARDGRYSLWLPLGNWQVTFSAPGHDPVTRTINVTGYDTPIGLDVDLVPTFVPATLLKSGSDRVGTSVTFTYTAPGDAGLGYWIPLSLGTVPGIAIGDRVLPLNGDALMVASLSLAPLLVDNLGVLSASESAVATLHLPNDPALAGITMFCGGVSFDPQFPLGVERWATPVQLTILP